MSGSDRARELGAFLAGIPFFASFDESTLVWVSVSTGASAQNACCTTSAAALSSGRSRC